MRPKTIKELQYMYGSNARHTKSWYTMYLIGLECPRVRIVCCFQILWASLLLDLQYELAGD